jgi:hypothetical protein
MKVVIKTEGRSVEFQNIRGTLTAGGKTAWIEIFSKGQDPTKMAVDPPVCLVGDFAEMVRFCNELFNALMSAEEITNEDGEG